MRFRFWAPRSPWARFPSEIILRIFHTAAQSSKDTCLTLTLVSSWTRQLALPYLFSTVSLCLPDNPYDEDSFAKFEIACYNVFSLDSPCSSCVRNLWVSEDMNLNGYGALFLRHMLSVCPGIIAVATTSESILMHLFGGTFDHDLPVPRTRDLRLTLVDPQQWYSTKSGRIFEMQQSSAFNVSLTHLRFAHFGSGTHLDRFTNLTHVAIPITTDMDLVPVDPIPTLEHALASPILQVLVLVSYIEDRYTFAGFYPVGWVQSVRRHDKRVYMVNATCDHEKEWQKEVEGWDGIWERAIRETEEMEEMME